MKKIGFSLVELMVAIIIISIIITALVPNITKKLSKNGITIGKMQTVSGTEISNNCSAFDSNCALCTTNKCLMCNDNYILKNGVCEGNISISDDCTEISENCKICTKDDCLVCDENSVLDNKTCIAKGTFGEPRYSKDCYKYNAVFIDKKYNGTFGKNICVTKYNAGDTGGPNVSSSIFLSGTHDASYTASYGSANVCFKGQTSYDCVNYGATSKYQSCTRTVCGYWAAYKACRENNGFGKSTGGWQLLALSIVRGWQSAYNSGDSEFINIIDNVLELCNGKTGLICGANNICLGNDASNWCSAHGVWAGEYTEASAFALSEATASVVANSLGASLSVRCYTDNVLLD